MITSRLFLIISWENEMSVKEIKEVFSFYFFMGRRSRRTKVFFLISLLPVIMAAIFKFQQVFAGNVDVEGLSIFTNIIMVVYLQFLILILSLFYGSSICLEEVEGKTMTYLVTRPIAKRWIILGKYLAYLLIIVAIIACGVIFSFLLLNFEALGNLSLYRTLFRHLGVLILGIICYTALFTFMGTFWKRSIFFGLIFSFGWENVIQYFPGSTQRFAIIHYLKSLLPPAGGRFSFLTFRLEPTAPGVAIITLFLLTAAFLSLGCMVFSLKEYISED